MGNLSNPSINRWGSSLCWFSLLKTTYFSTLLVQRTLLAQQLVYCFMQGGLTGNSNLLTRKPLPWISISKVIKPKEEPWFQKRYYKRVKFRSSFLDEDIPFFERRYNSRLYMGQIKILHLKTWTLLLVHTLSTFTKQLPMGKHKKKWTTVYLPSNITDKHMPSTQFDISSWTSMKILQNDKKVQYLF